MSVGSVKLSDQPMPRSSRVSLKNVVYSCGVSKHMISLGLSVRYVSEALRAEGDAGRLLGNGADAAGVPTDYVVIPSGGIHKEHP